MLSTSFCSWLVGEIILTIIWCFHYITQRDVCFFLHRLSMKRKFHVTRISHWNIAYLYVLTFTHKHTIEFIWGKNKRVYFYMCTVFLILFCSSYSLLLLLLLPPLQTQFDMSEGKTTNIEWNDFIMNLIWRSPFVFAFEIVCSLFSPLYCSFFSLYFYFIC